MSACDVKCKVISPILLLLGTVGNVLSIIVLSRRNLRGSQASLYLIALSLTDITVLYSGLLRHFLRYAVSVDIRDVSEIWCKLNIATVYASLDISVWILVAFTFERLLSVYVPHKVRSYCTRVSSCVVIGTILCVFLALNCHFIFGYGAVILQVSPEETVTISCYPLSKNYAHFMKKVWPWIDFSVFNLLPCLVFICGNTCIAIKVWASRRKTKRIEQRDCTVTQPVAMVESYRTNNEGGQMVSTRTNKTSFMTAILILLNFLFLITTTPVSIFFIIDLEWEKSATTKTDFALIELTFTVVNLVMYVNNATNFILYCVTGSRFRKELKNIFCRKQNRIHPERVDDVANREVRQGVVHQRTASTTLVPPVQEDNNDTKL